MCARGMDGFCLGRDDALAAGDFFRWGLCDELAQLPELSNNLLGRAHCANGETVNGQGVYN